jgi:hypothetical protein
LSAAPVTLPLWAAKTIVVWPPLKAGNLAVRTAAAFCAGCGTGIGFGFRR